MINGQSSLACILCAMPQEAHPAQLLQLWASAGRALPGILGTGINLSRPRGSQHQESEGSRWKQQSVKMLDCRPALGWEEVRGRCPKKVPDQRREAAGRLRALAAQDADVWYSAPVLIRFGELQTPRIGITLALRFSCPPLSLLPR